MINIRYFYKVKKFYIVRNATYLQEQDKQSCKSLKNYKSMTQFCTGLGNTSACTGFPGNPIIKSIESHKYQVIFTFLQ